MENLTFTIAELVPEDSETDRKKEQRGDHYRVKDVGLLHKIQSAISHDISNLKSSIKTLLENSENCFFLLEHSTSPSFEVHRILKLNRKTFALLFDENLNNHSS